MTGIFPRPGKNLYDQIFVCIASENPFSAVATRYRMIRLDWQLDREGAICRVTIPPLTRYHTCSPLDRADGRGSAESQIPDANLHMKRKRPMRITAAVPPAVLRDDISWLPTKDIPAPPDISLQMWLWIGDRVGVPLSEAIALS